MFCGCHLSDLASVRIGGHEEDSPQVFRSPRIFHLEILPPSFKPPLAPRLLASSKRRVLAGVSQSLEAKRAGGAHHFCPNSLTTIHHPVPGCKGSGNCNLPVCPGENSRFAEHVAMSLPQKHGTLLPHSVTGQQSMVMTIIEA